MFAKLCRALIEVRVRKYMRLFPDSTRLDALLHVRQEIVDEIRFEATDQGYTYLLGLVTDELVRKPA